MTLIELKPRKLSLGLTLEEKRPRTKVFPPCERYGVMSYRFAVLITADRMCYCASRDLWIVCCETGMGYVLKSRNPLTHCFSLRRNLSFD